MLLQTLECDSLQENAFTNYLVQSKNKRKSSFTNIGMWQFVGFTSDFNYELFDLEKNLKG